MNGYELSNSAQADLGNIWLYIASDRPSAADQMIERLTDAFNHLAQHPQSGEARPALGRRVRVFSVRDYAVYFRPTLNGVDIMRVIHGARQISDLHARD